MADRMQRNGTKTYLRGSDHGRVIRGLILCSFLGSLSFLTGASSAASDNRGVVSRPNVLILMSDDHRADVMGVAGDTAVVTPNMDRLAAEGIRFTHFASQSPVCVPSRATIMTGMYQSAHQVLPLTPMDVDTTYLAEAFVDGGYSTGYAGKWHLNGISFFGNKADEGYVPPDARAGFQEWDAYDSGTDHDRPTTFDETQDPPLLVDVPGYDWTPSYYSDVFLDFAERHASDDEPWMYFLSYALPHRPEEAPQEFLDMFPPASMDLFGLAPELEGNITPEEEQRFREILQAYYAQISFLDSEIGIVLDGLEALGLDDDTLVVYFSDHGELLGSHYFDVRDVGSPLGDDPEIFFRAKSLPYAASIRAPLIMRWPGNIPAGLEVDALMSTVDFPMTILDLAGLDVPRKMQGNSMREWCLGEVGPQVDGIYLSAAVIDGKVWEGVWTGNYVYSSDGDLKMLYDHTNDAQELNNLFDDPAYSAIQDDLQQMVDELAIAAATIPDDGGGGNCLIATMAAGTPLASELDIIRAFRNDVLLDNPLGGIMASAYYRVSSITAPRVRNASGASGVIETSGLIQNALPGLVLAVALTFCSHFSRRRRA